MNVGFNVRAVGLITGLIATLPPHVPGPGVGLCLFAAILIPTQVIDSTGH